MEDIDLIGNVSLENVALEEEQAQPPPPPSSPRKRARASSSQGMVMNLNRLVNSLIDSLSLKPTLIIVLITLTLDLIILKGE